MTAYFIFHAFCITHNLSFMRYCAKSDPQIVSKMLKISGNKYLFSFKLVVFVIFLAPLTWLALVSKSKDSLGFILDYLFKEEAK